MSQKTQLLGPSFTCFAANNKNNGQKQKNRTFHDQSFNLNLEQIYQPYCLPMSHYDEEYNVKLESQFQDYEDSNEGEYIVAGKNRKNIWEVAC